MLYIVPDSLRDAINAKLDAALAEVPDAAPDRDLFYEQVLSYFNQHGVLPDFSIVPKDAGIIGTLK